MQSVKRLSEYNEKRKMKNKLFIISILCLCFSLSAQDSLKKPLKDWDIIEAEKPEHVKVVKFLKEQKEIIEKDSIQDIAPSKNEEEEKLADYYQEVSKRVIEQRMRDSTLMAFRPPVPDWDKPLVADSITGEIGPKILEAYWMNEFGEKITKICPYQDCVAYLFVRTQCYLIGTKIKITLSKKNGNGFENGEQEIKRIIYTDEDGIAILANNIWK